jgi:hypothetical protein
VDASLGRHHILHRHTLTGISEQCRRRGSKCRISCRLDALPGIKGLSPQLSAIREEGLAVARARGTEPALQGTPAGIPSCGRLSDWFGSMRA